MKKNPKFLSLCVLFFILCSTNIAFANYSGGQFRGDNLFPSLTWDAANSRVIIPVCVYDTYGNGKNEGVHFDMSFNGTPLIHLEINGEHGDATSVNASVYLRSSSPIASGNPRVLDGTKERTFTSTGWQDVYANQHNEYGNNVNRRYVIFYYYPTTNGSLTVKLYNVKGCEEKSAGTWHNEADVEKTISYTVYPKLSNLTASVQNNGNVRLAWNVVAGNANNPTNPNGYDVQMRNKSANGNLTWVNVKSGTRDYAYSETSHAVEIQYPYSLLKALSNVNYEFRVRRVGTEWEEGTTTEVSLPPFPQPQNVSITNDPGNSTLKMHWTMTASTGSSPNPNYTVQWKEGNGTWQNLTNITSGNLNYSAGETEKTVVFDYPILNQGTKNLQFRIKRSNWDWDETVTNWTSGSYSSGYATTTTYQQQSNLNTNSIELKNISVVSDSSGVNVHWANSDGRLKKNWYFRLYRKNPSTPNFNFQSDFIQEIKAENLTSPSIWDKHIAACTPADYLVRLEDGARETAVVMAQSDVLNNKEHLRIPSSAGDITKYKVSKGFFNDRVELSWSSSDDADFARYTVTRQDVLDPNVEDVIIYDQATTASKAFNIVDNTAISGVYYNYRVDAWGECNGVQKVKSSKNTYGFTQALGIVSGQVSYAGGTAVKDVQIIADADKTSMYSNRSIRFNREKGNYVSLPYKENSCDPNHFSFQTWLRINSQSDTLSVLMQSHSRYSVYLTKDFRIRLYSFKKDGSQMFQGGRDFNYVVPQHEWVHITVTWDIAGSVGTAKLYINGQFKEEWSASVTNPGFAPTPTDTSANGYYVFFAGHYQVPLPLDAYMDEVKIWRKTLDSTSIKLNYNRYLTGKEDGLSLYYRFDELIDDVCFDISKTGNSYNENHGTVHAVTALGQMPPRSVDMVPPVYNKGVTDENGNYLITTIPYSGEGTNITLRPTLGVHEFSPSNKPMFFNKQANTYSNVDFTDKSSFKVSGHVYYENSNYPVQDVMIYVDGAPANKDGQLVKTNANGYYEVNVPIGKHFISVELSGHTFTNGASFPAFDTETMPVHPRFDFNDSIRNINFYDNTKVYLVGKVVGGDIQKNLPLGFNKAKANIGSAEITLKNDRLDVMFDTIPILSRYNTAAVVGKMYSINGDGTYIKFHTDSTSGEFCVAIPPIPYTVNGAKTAEFGLTDPVNDFSFSKRTLNINPLMQKTLKDSTITSNVLRVDSIKVHDSLVVVRYNEALLSVTDMGNKHGAFGDSIFVYENAVTNEKDTVVLYTVENSYIEYKLDVPVFSQDVGTYYWKLKMYEEYTNPATSIVDTVPWAYKELEIHNGLASKRIDIDTIAGMSLQQSDVVVILDDKGEQTYTFTTGFPNLGSGHLLHVNITGNNNGKLTQKDFDGILFGQVPSSGNNFITKGPDLVEFVLHDPPGTHSKSWIEAGSSVTQTIEIGTVESNGLLSRTNISFAPKVATSFGIGIAVIKEDEIYVEANVNIKKYWKTISNKESVSKTTFLQSISTSDNREFVGPMADVYVGKSTNAVFGMTRDLKLYPKNEYQSNETEVLQVKSNKGDTLMLFNQEHFSVNVNFPTHFNYTQKYIIETLIPNIKSIRNDMIDLCDCSEYPDSSTVFFPSGVTVRYLSKLPKNHPDFGKNGNYKPYVKLNGAYTLSNDSVYLDFYFKGNALAKEMEYVSEYPNPDTVTFTGSKLKRYFTTDNRFSTTQNSLPNGFSASSFKIYAKRYEIDEIQAYNDWIAAWEQTISNNEKAKIDIISKRPTLESKNNPKIFENISFSSGVDVEKKYETEFDTITKTGNGQELEREAYAKSGAKILKIGIKEELGYVGKTDSENIKGNGYATSCLFGLKFSEDATTYEAGVSPYDALTVDVYGPDSDEMKSFGASNHSGYLMGPIFQTRAGQTSCPWEGGDTTLFYKDSISGNSYTLNYGTFKVENPVLYVDRMKEATVEEVPAGREATFRLYLQNQSESHNSVAYQLKVKDNSNPHGLILSIDGTPLTAPRTYNIAYGEEIEKTLKVKQSTLDIMDYKDIEIVLSSQCDEQIEDAVKVSAHFAPSSTDVALSALNGMMNLVGGDGARQDTAVAFLINGYDRYFRYFSDLQLQYKNANTTVWNVAHNFVYYPNNSPSYSDLQGDSILKSSITYTFPMNERPDGTYEFRVVSRAKFGNSYTPVYSNVVTVIKDVTKPAVFGVPSPSGGILTADGEVSVTFNEQIKSGSIQKDNTKFSNISVKAVKNAAKVKHNAALKLTGGMPVQTEANIVLANKSFTIETYFKLNDNSSGTLIAHGNDLKIGFDAAHHIVITGNDSIFISDDIIDANVWYYLTFSYNADTKFFSLGIYSEAVSKQVTFHSGASTQINLDYNSNSKLYIGANSNASNAISALIHELSIWNSFQTSLADNHLQFTKSGNEVGLIGYWALDEGHGTVATDKARSRHLILPNPNMWYSIVDNYAVKLDGQSYIAINATQTGIQTGDDYTVEFWFKGGQQNNATLFSCGDGILDYEPSKKLSVATNNSGKLVLKSNGVETLLSNTIFLDNAWHHFALNVLRNSSNIVYIDGQTEKQLPANVVHDMIGDKFVFGARAYHNNAKDTIDHYFNGYIDEIRIWRASNTGEKIKQNIYNELTTAEENGLVAYYPFNRLVYGEQNIVTTKPALENFTPSDVRVQMIVGKDTAFVIADSIATLGGNAVLQDTEAPVLQPQRLLEDVACTFSANAEKIILNITEAPSLIENCTLEMSVKNIVDLSNNPSNVINWTAYVHRNRLVWSEELLDLEKQYLDEKTFTVQISNRSGTADNWLISNLPSWLTVNETQGTLQPLTSKTLTFKVLESTLVGHYEAQIYLTGNQSINTKLGIKLKVIHEIPDWQVIPENCAHSISVIGQLYFDNHVSTDPDDMLAVFQNGVCLGFAKPTYYAYYDAYYVLMDIFCKEKESDNMPLVFKAFDASTGEIYPVVTVSQPISSKQLLYGNMQSPVAFNAENKSEQVFALQNGWNWISFNTKPDNFILDEVFKSVKSKILFVKNQTKFTRINTHFNFYGELKNLETGLMYKVQTNGATPLSVIGNKLNPQNESISVASGWSWIGYIPEFSLPVKDALADLEPEEGDFIKGQQQFAIYTNGSWIGSLRTLAPNRGYIYQSKANRTKTFTYPSVALANVRASYASSRQAEYFTPVSSAQYSGNMSIIGVVKQNGEILGNMEVGVFAGDECRGANVTDGEGMLYISVMGDESVPLTFRVYNHTTGKSDNLLQTMNYVDDDIIGTYEEPYIFNLDITTGNQPLIFNSQFSIYPNPVKDFLFVEQRTDNKEQILEIYGINGTLVHLHTCTPARLQSINVAGLPTGSYFIKAGDDVAKFVKE